MRGSEGIAERVQSLYFTQGNSVILADFQSSEISVDLPAGNLSVSLKTDYPFDDKIDLIINESNLREDATLKLFIPSWIENVRLSKGGKPMDVTMDGSYLVLAGEFKSSEEYELSFTQKLGEVKPHGNNTAENLFKIQYGPLVLGVEGQENNIKLPQALKIRKNGSTVFQIEGTDITLHPVYHLMDEKVSKKGEYKSQVLFSYKN